jgi:hypothetical protein
MNLETLSLGLDVLLIFVWIYATYLALELANFQKNMGAYVSAMPYFVGASVLFLLIRIMAPAQTLVFSGNLEIATNYLLSLDTIQIVAGVILFRGIHEVHKENFATEGFQGVEE